MVDLGADGREEGDLMSVFKKPELTPASPAPRRPTSQTAAPGRSYPATRRSFMVKTIVSGALATLGVALYLRASALLVEVQSHGPNILNLSDELVRLGGTVQARESIAALRQAQDAVAFGHNLGALLILAAIAVWLVPVLANAIKRWARS